MKIMVHRALTNLFSKRNVFCVHLILLFFPLFSTPVISSENEIAPQRDIYIEEESLVPSKPEWKMVWDRSRMLVRQNQLKEAKSGYERLFDLKPNIVVAKWEYCQLLVRLEEWPDSARVIEELLELEPHNLEFLFTGGKIALANAHYNRAVEYFGQVLEGEPAGPLSERATGGLIEALSMLDNQKAAYLLLEQHVLRGNDDDSSLKQLGQLSLEMGAYERAAKHYAKLVKRHPENKDFLYQLALIHELRGDIAGAAGYWQQYLKINPGFKRFHLKLGQFHLDRHAYREAVGHLAKAFDLGDREDSILALQIGNIYYDHLGRRDKALSYYERYTRSSAENREVVDRVESIRDSLAEEYLPLVENDIADNLWRDLDVVTNDKKEIFLRIAQLLNDRKNDDAEKVVLDILYENGQLEDLTLVYRLAELSIDAGENKDAYTLLLFLDANKFINPLYLRKKAELELLAGDELKALQTYKRYIEYLENTSEALVTLEEAMSLAGDIGLVDEVQWLWQKALQREFTPEELFPLKLIYIEALRKNRLYGLADEVYAGLFSAYTNDSEMKAKIYHHLAETFKHRGFYFKAEQLHRQNVARSMVVDEAIIELIRLAILQNQDSLAESWLYLLSQSRGVANIDEESEKLPEEIHFLYVEHLIGSHEYDDALEQIERHSQYRSNQDSPSHYSLKSSLYVARALFFQEEYNQCLEFLNTLNAAEEHAAEIHVLYKIILSRIAGKYQATPVVQQSDKVAISQRIKRAKWFQAYGEYSMALNEIEVVLDNVPESLLARIERIRILAELSYGDEALTQLKPLMTIYPDEQYFTTLQLELEFQRGDFSEIVKKISARTKKKEEQEEIPTVQDSQDIYFYRKLLLARALWAENKREESFAVYNSLLAQPVDTVFLEKLEIDKINFKLPPLKKPFWDILSFTVEDEGPLPMVMTPQFVTQNIGEPIDNIAAGLYGKYKWQQLVKQELSAREAVQKRDYHEAEKKYLALLEQEKSPESIFDLADVYDKLGLHGKAGELYQLMKEKGPLYPGLDESIQANYLKRQPRIATVLEAIDKKGREGYVNLKRRSYGVEGWLMPAFDQEFSVQAYFNEYRATNSQDSFRKQRLVGSYNTYFENHTDVNFKAGIDTPVRSGSKELVFNIEVFHRLNETVEMYGRFEQDILEHTLRSVTDSIIFSDIETGVKIDLFPRLFIGGDYRYRLYSDDNYQSRYKLWSQYHLFGELNQFKVNYSYEYLQHGDGNLGRQDDFSNVFAPGDKVYWSPKNYWQHEATLHFKHYLDKTPHGNSLLNYCSIDYSWGYDTNSELSHEIDLNIFLEMSRHFLLRSNLRFVEGDDLEETQAFFSIIYRW